MDTNNTPLTPEIMVECGYSYLRPGTSGADMWQGMGWWKRRDGKVNFRGHYDRMRPLTLSLEGYFNSRITSVEDLKYLYHLLTGEQLK